MIRLYRVSQQHIQVKLRSTDVMWCTGCCDACSFENIFVQLIMLNMLKMVCSICRKRFENSMNPQLMHNWTKIFSKLHASQHPAHHITSVGLNFTWICCLETWYRRITCSEHHLPAAQIEICKIEVDQQNTALLTRFHLSAFLTCACQKDSYFII